MTDSLTEKVALEPCPNPWCECNAVQVYEGISGRFDVRCSCGIEGPWGDTEAEAITAWNTRAIATLTEPSEAEIHARACDIVNRHCEYENGLGRGQMMMRTGAAIAAVEEALRSSTSGSDQ